MDTRTQVSTFNPTRHPLRTVLATACVALAATLAQMPAAHAAGGDGTGPRAGMGMMDHERGAGMGRHGHHGKGMHDGGARMLDLAKATPEQRAQIKQIAEAARADMAGQREAGRKLHEQMQAQFTQPTIDSRAVEALRQQMLAHHDQASKRMLQMRLDMAAVLTPEQRKAVAERIAQRRDMAQRHRSERATLGDKPAR